MAPTTSYSGIIGDYVSAALDRLVVVLVYAYVTIGSIFIGGVPYAAFQGRPGEAIGNIKILVLAAAVLAALDAGLAWYYDGTPPLDRIPWAASFITVLFAPTIVFGALSGLVVPAQISGISQLHAAISATVIILSIVAGPVMYHLIDNGWVSVPGTRPEAENGGATN